MAINDKLNRIKEIKEDIKQALIDKGVEVTDEDSFGSYADKITNIPQEGGGDPYYEDFYNMRTNNGTNMTGLFARMTGNSLDLTGLDTSQCTDMSYMFNNCYIPNLDLSDWDLSSVTDMSYMFYNCQSTSINMTGWDTSKVNNMSNMLYTCKAASAIIPFLNTDSVTNMYYMFNDYNETTLDLSNFNTTNVTNMKNIFNFAYNSKVENLIIPNWDMTNTKDSSSFFGYSSETYAKNLKYVDLSNSNDLTISKIVSYLPKKTEATYGDIVIPADSSQEVIDACIAKYWRPVGPSFVTESFQIDAELDEILSNGKTKIAVHSFSPWYTATDNIEFIVSDDSIVTVDNNGEVKALSLGNVEIYARLKNSPEVISNTITITVSENDSKPYVIKFKGTSTPTSSNYMIINGSKVLLSNMDYNSNTGVYTYDVGSEITAIEFNGSKSESTGNTITELIKFDFNGNNITDMSSMFNYCNKLKSLDLSSWDVSNVTSMYQLFRYCTTIEAIDVSTWDTSKVTKMDRVFYYCFGITTLDLTTWDTGSVESFTQMFTDVPQTSTIYVNDETWDATESQCSFSGTFIRVNPEYYTEYSIDSSTATFNMRSIDSINSGAYLPELSNGYDAVLLTLNDGSITTDLDTEANQVSSIKIYYPEETSYVKFANTKVKEVIHLNGSNITDCTGMFTNCVYLEKADLTSLDSAKVTVDTTMFEGVNTEAEVTFNESWDIPESDIGRGEPEIENPYYVEYTIDKTNSTDTVSTTGYLPKLFSNDTEFTNYVLRIILTDGSETDDLNTLVSDINEIKIEYDETVTKLTFDSVKVNQLNYINTSKFTSMQQMFRKCTYLTSLNASNFDTSNVTNIDNMFFNCTGLTSLDLTSWNTESVTKMRGTFRGCSNLATLNVSNWNTSNVEDMVWTFSSCKSLAELNLSNWNTNSVSTSSYMLQGLKVGIDWHYDGTNYTNWTLTESQTGFSGTFPWNA